MYISFTSRLKINLTSLVLCLGIFVLFTAAPVMAQEFFDKQVIEDQINIQKKEIELIEPVLSEENITEERILELRQILRTARTELQKNIAIIQPAHKSAKADIDDFGPKPEGENAVPEPENILKQRAALNEKFLTLEGLLKQSEALNSKSERLLSQVSSLRRGLFVKQLFNKQVLPFDMKLWTGAINNYYSQLSNYKLLFVNKVTVSIGKLIIACFVFLGLFWGALFLSKKSFLTKLKSDVSETQCSVFSYLASSLMLPLLASTIGLLIIYQTLNTQGVVNEINRIFIYESLGFTGFFLFVCLMAKRLVKAKIIRPSMRWLAIVSIFIYAADALLLESGKVTGADVETVIAQSYAVTSIFALLLLLFSIAIFKLPSNTEIRNFFSRQISFALIGTALFIMISNVFGYAAFSRYLFECLIQLFSLFIVVSVIRAFLRLYLHRIDNLFSDVKRDEVHEHLIFFWLSLSLDIALFIIYIPVIAIIAGAEWQTIKHLIVQAFFGFKVGAMTISIANISLAVCVFLVLLFMTRIIQRVLEREILPKTKINEDVCQSVTQILGYIGLTIALIAGISTVGFDMTNLALIAGALSVGIGFGLQGIVNNFVSGLILLFERPIKNGDWIITNSGEGIVKKIKVRATEIETFDRTTIIIPNSELVSSSVKNWTHTDKTGRVIIPVGVSYSSDPQQVHDILLELIANNKEVLKNPEPMIYFKDFGDSALIFEVRFFIKNIKDILIISKKVRFDIWEAFKKSNIEISFPQRDLHIRTAPGLEGLINRK